jgi:hypothetical protein
VWGGGANRVHDPRRLSTRRPRVGPRAPSAFAIRAPIRSAAVGESVEGWCADDRGDSALTLRECGRTMAGHEDEYVDRNETSSE